MQAFSITIRILAECFEYRQRISEYYVESRRRSEAVLKQIIKPEKWHFWFQSYHEGRGIKSGWYWWGSDTQIKIQNLICIMRARLRCFLDLCQRPWAKRFKRSKACGDSQFQSVSGCTATGQSQGWGSWFLKVWRSLRWDGCLARYPGSKDWEGRVQTRSALQRHDRRDALAATEPILKAQSAMN